MVHRSLQWNRLAMIEVPTCQGSRQSLAPEQVASELAVPLRLGQSVYNFFRGNVTSESPELGQMGSEQLCLSWNDYEGNFSVAFRDLRQEKEFFDVTLACKDGQLQAHKVILSSCSTFFKDILKRNPHVHPLLYLKDVKLSHLQAVTDFMYQGKVNVEQKELDAFLALARELQVKGLNQNESPEEKKAKETVKKVETDSCLKIRKPEDLFKPQVLGKDSKEEDERASGDLDTMSKKRRSRWDSIANGEHQEDDRASDTTCSCICGPCEHELKKSGFSEEGLAGLRGQADSSTAVQRDAEERGADSVRGHFVNQHVGNTCSSWNWGYCRFGQMCRYEHRCSRKLQNGYICESTFHNEKNHFR